MPKRKTFLAAALLSCGLVSPLANADSHWAADLDQMGMLLWSYQQAGVDNIVALMEANSSSFQRQDAFTRNDIKTEIREALGKEYGPYDKISSGMILRLGEYDFDKQRFPVAEIELYPFTDELQYSLGQLSHIGQVPNVRLHWRGIQPPEFLDVAPEPARDLQYGANAVVVGSLTFSQSNSGEHAGHESRDRGSYFLGFHLDIHVDELYVLKPDSQTVWANFTGQPDSILLQFGGKPVEAEVPEPPQPAASAPSSGNVLLDKCRLHAPELHTYQLTRGGREVTPDQVDTLCQCVIGNSAMNLDRFVIEDPTSLPDDLGAFDSTSSQDARNYKVRIRQCGRFLR